MTIRIIGAVFIIFGCAGFGIAKAINYRKEEQTIRQLVHALVFMKSELQYRLTSLPDLCMAAAEAASGVIGEVLSKFSDNLRTYRYSNPRICMDKLIIEYPALPNSAKKILRQLGKCMGKFDLDGQLKGIEYIKSQCDDILNAFEKDADVRVRNYQTLGLCAGVALVILLI